MLKIAICDDNARDRERIAEDLRAYAAAHGEYGIEFAVYDRKTELLDHARRKTTQKVNLYEKVQIPGY